MISLVMPRPITGIVPDRTPLTGDVVIRRAGPDGTPIYAMSAVPGPDQCGCATRAETERIARSFARRSEVSLWFAETPLDFMLLDSFRPPTRKHRPSRASDGTPGAIRGRQAAAPRPAV
jgi:hypothetical protein